MGGSPVKNSKVNFSQKFTVKEEKSPSIDICHKLILEHYWKLLLSTDGHILVTTKLFDVTTLVGPCAIVAPVEGAVLVDAGPAEVQVQVPSGAMPGRSKAPPSNRCFDNQMMYLSVLSTFN